MVQINNLRVMIVKKSIRIKNEKIRKLIGVLKQVDRVIMRVQ